MKKIVLCITGILSAMIGLLLIQAHPLFSFVLIPIGFILFVLGLRAGKKEKKQPDGENRVPSAADSQPAVSDPPQELPKEQCISEPAPDKSKEATEKKEDTIILYDDESYTVRVVPEKYRFNRNVELQRKTDNTTEVIPLPRSFFAIFEEEDLVKRITEFLKLTDGTQKADVYTAIRNNNQMHDLFGNERKNLICNRKTGAVNRDAEEIVEKLKFTDAFDDATKEIFSSLDYFHDHGSPIEYNYIKMHENIPVNEAVRQYLTLKDAGAHRIARSGLSANIYSVDLVCILLPWYYDSTFLIVNDSNMMLPPDELESMYRLCKENDICIIKEVKWHTFYDYIDDSWFQIIDDDYPGSADDAAVYSVYEFKTIEKPLQKTE